jgi:hypothetical protein
MTPLQGAEKSSRLLVVDYYTWRFNVRIEKISFLTVAQ